MRQMKRFDEMPPNHRTSFEMLYNHACRALARLERQLEYDYKQAGVLQSPRVNTNLHRIRHKLEQMSAKWKSK